MADNSNAIVDLGKLTEPLSKLVDAVSSAVGVLFEPTRIRRKATADAEAAIILARADVEVMSIQHRAAKRLLDSETRRQENIESIVRKSVEELPNDVDSEPVDPDWVHQFFDSCQDIGNEDMQQLWARLLAGEVAKPGQFSARSLSILKHLSKGDAEVLSTIGSTAWKSGEFRFLTIYDTKDTRLIERGITFDSLTHMEGLGLIKFDALAGFIVRAASTSTHVEYHGERFDLELGVLEIPMGHAMLTSPGLELLRLAHSPPVKSFKEFAIEYWRKNGIQVCPTAVVSAASGEEFVGGWVGQI